MVRWTADAIRICLRSSLWRSNCHMSPSVRPAEHVDGRGRLGAHIGPTAAHPRTLPPRPPANDEARIRGRARPAEARPPTKFSARVQKRRKNVRELRYGDSPRGRFAARQWRDDRRECPSTRRAPRRASTFFSYFGARMGGGFCGGAAALPRENGGEEPMSTECSGALETPSPRPPKSEIARRQRQLRSRAEG